MTEQNLLQHLLRTGLTPSFSFPLDVAEFRAEGLAANRSHVWPKMQQDLKKALVEYSPGRILTVDGTDYKVEGLYVYGANDGVNRAREHFEHGVDFKRLWYYNRCTDDGCGWVSDKLEEALYAADETGTCPVCNSEDSVKTGIWYRPDGFAPKVVPWDARGSRPNRNTPWGPTMKADKVRKSGKMQPSGGVEFPAPINNEPDDIFEDYTVVEMSQERLEQEDAQQLGEFLSA